MAATLLGAGHARNVRKSWTLEDGKPDNVVSGRENGHLALAHVGYARVSSTDQSPAMQLDALASVGCKKVFEDRASGAKADRVGLRSALDYVRDGDVLIVWKLDRLGRSLPHLIETVTSLEKRGVGFRSITEAIDTTTPGGRLVFHLFGALGQFERDLIQERTRAGLVAAAARGRKGGRKPVVNTEKLGRARAIIGRGFTVREAAIRLKIGKTALYESLRSNRVETETGSPDARTGPNTAATVGAHRQARRRAPRS
jgi:DNA invertase Pin-like site-specific DNA recombinase